MTDTERSDGFDWVKARSECTLEKEFDRLAKAVQRDLERHNALNPGIAQCQTFHICCGDRFYIQRKGEHRVIFEMERGRIRIGRWARKGEHTPITDVTVRLDEEGQCILIGEDGRLWRPWQIRRLALEETFFGESLLPETT